jgi:hypothetical protein
VTLTECRQQRIDRGGIRDIEAVALKRRAQRIRVGFAVRIEVRNHDTPVLRSQCPRDFEADAAGAAGNEYDW